MSFHDDDLESDFADAIEEALANSVEPAMPPSPVLADRDEDTLDEEADRLRAAIAEHEDEIERVRLDRDVSVRGLEVERDRIQRVYERELAGVERAIAEANAAADRQLHVLGRLKRSGELALAGLQEDDAEAPPLRGSTAALAAADTVVVDGRLVKSRRRR